MSRILYRLLAALARPAVRSSRSKDLEIIVLRHQLTVLGRQADRPAIDDEDRTLLSAIAAALPQPRRQGWLATPESAGMARTTMFLGIAFTEALALIGFVVFTLLLGG